MLAVANFLEWFGVFFGLLGALFLATNTKVSRYGWLLLFVGSASLTVFALIVGKLGMILHQAGFCAISALGLYRTGLFK